MTDHSDKDVGGPQQASEAAVEAVEGEVVEPTELVVAYPPRAGEVIDLADTPTVGRVIRGLMDWMETTYKPVMEVLRSAVIRQADTEARYTLHYGGLTITCDSPNKVERHWEDPIAMHTALVQAGMPLERANEIVRLRVVHEVVWGEAKKAMANPAYAAIIERHKIETPGKRYVRVQGA